MIRGIGCCRNDSDPTPPRQAQCRSIQPDTRFVRQAGSCAIETATSVSKLTLALGAWSAAVCCGTTIWLAEPKSTVLEQALPEVFAEKKTEAIAVAIGRNGTPFGHFETKILYRLKTAEQKTSESVIPIQDSLSHHLILLARQRPELFMHAKPDLKAIAQALQAAVAHPDIATLDLQYGQIRVTLADERK